MSIKAIEDYWKEFDEAVQRMESYLPLEPEEYQMGPFASFNLQFDSAIRALGALGELIWRAMETLDSLQIIGWDSIAGTLGVSRRTAIRWKDKLMRAGILSYEKVGDPPQERPIASYLRLISYKMSREKRFKNSNV